VTVRMKLTLLLGAVVSAEIAIWGLKQMLNGSLDPILKALHG